MKKVLFIDDVHPLIEEQLSTHGYRCEYFPDYGRVDFIRIIPQYFGVIIRSKITLDEEILSLAKNLKFIARVGAGMESINVEYARARGILCINSPEGNRDAVGEHATGMLLSLMNHMDRADRQVREGKWEREQNRGTEILGKTVGIIGYGNMGSAFAKRLSGFGCSVLSYDKYKTDYSDGFAVESSLEDLFEMADIVSLHVPLTEETRYMANGRFFRSFQKNIWFINTSRGMVVKTSDLADALKSGKVRGAALDVLEYEDTSFELLRTNVPGELRYLMGLENVLFTPHIAGWTVESKYKLAKVLVDKIKTAFPSSGFIQDAGRNL